MNNYRNDSVIVLNSNISSLFLGFPSSIVTLCGKVNKQGKGRREKELEPVTDIIAWGAVRRGKVEVITESVADWEWSKRAVPEARRILIGIFDTPEAADRAAREYYVSLPLNRRAARQFGTWIGEIEWDTTSPDAAGR
jgi:hypothetical protein